MNAVCISLFGKFSIRRDEQDLAGLEAYKLRELFSYLLLHRGRPHSRAVLSGLLWGDMPTAQSKKRLRQTLWQLQNILEPSSGALDGQLIEVQPEWVQIDPGTKYWLDVAVLERVFALVREVPGHRLDTRRKRLLHSAVDLYRGELLEGWYQDWCLFERERLQNIYLSMLNKLMSYCEAHRQYDSGLLYGMRILQIDCAHERTHRRLMRMRYLDGDRSAALRQYESCAAALEEELGVAPAKSTQLLYDKIRDDSVDGAPTNPPENGASAGTADASLHALLRNLEQAQSELSAIQKRLQKDIQTVRASLNS